MTNVFKAILVCCSAGNLFGNEPIIISLPQSGLSKFNGNENQIRWVLKFRNDAGEVISLKVDKQNEKPSVKLKRDYNVVYSKSFDSLEDRLDSDIVFIAHPSGDLEFNCNDIAHPGRYKKIKELIDYLDRIYANEKDNMRQFVLNSIDIEKFSAQLLKRRSYSHIRRIHPSNKKAIKKVRLNLISFIAEEISLS